MLRRLLEQKGIQRAFDAVWLETRVCRLLDVASFIAEQRGSIDANNTSEIIRFLTGTHRAMPERICLVTPTMPFGESDVSYSRCGRFRP